MVLFATIVLFLNISGSVGAAVPATTAPVPALPGPQPDAVAKGKQKPRVAEGSVLVRLAPGPAAGKAPAGGGDVLAEHRLERRRAVGGSGFVEVGTRGRSAGAVRKELKGDPRVQAVEPNYVRTASASADTFLGQQWPLGLARFPQAWQVQPNAPTVTVAVVDSGVDLDHPDLFEQIVPGWDAVGDDAFPQDENGHGTMVAGLVGATADNGRGIAGGAFTTRIQPVRVLGADGSGTDLDVIEGITWAADHGAKVINLSLGGPEPSAALAAAVADAQAKGALVVAASGNTSGGEAHYPAALPGVLTVSATDWTGRLAWFSSHGAEVDLAAGGADVFSTSLGAGTEDSYATGSGTSFAAPLVSAAAALLRQAHPTWTAARVSLALTSTARDAGPPGHDDAYGFGILDAAAALGVARQEPVPPEAGDGLEPNPVPEQASPLTGTASGTISPESDVDWFTTDIATPRWSTITVTPPGVTGFQAMDPTITVYGPSGGEVASIDGAGAGRVERLIFEVQTPGRHLVRIDSHTASTSAGSYTVDLASSPSPPSSFTPYSSHRTRSWPESTSIADLTGDGRGDVVMTTTFYFNEENDYSVFVFPQREDGSLGKPTKYRPTGAGDMSTATGDLDEDGDADLAVATSAGVEVFFQAGGVLASPEVLTFLGTPSQVEITDLDGDGDNDLLAMTDGGIEWRMWQGGSWMPPIALTADRGNELEAGDISGDGRIDFVVTRQECPPAGDCLYGATTHVQQPDGTFARVHHPTVFGGFLSAVAIGDVNGDGRNDVTVTIASNRPYASINTFYQGADGALGKPVVKQLYDIPEPIEAGDVNADGRVDLVTAHGGWYALGTIVQQPDGSLGGEVLDRAPYASHYDPKGLSLGDADGRPGLDVALADYNNGLLVYRQARATPTGERRWVDATNPLDGQLTVPTSGSVSITFARDMDPASLTAATTPLLAGASLQQVPAARVYDTATRRLTVTPAVPLAAGVAYQLVVAGVRDGGGDQMVDREVVRFRTAGATPPPTTTTTTQPTPTTTTTTQPPSTTTTVPGSTPTTTPPPTTTPAPPRSGYWMLGTAGAVYGFGDAVARGRAPVPAGQTAASMVATASGSGYWVTTSTGTVLPFGDAAQLGGSPALRAGEAVTSISAHPGGGGYWLFTNRGRVFAYGTARSFGDLAAVQLSGPVLGSVATPTGRGYYMVAADGGIFAFGDAAFRGSMGGQPLHAPVVGLAPDPDGAGYWLVASDGGIFSFASAFRGSVAGVRLNRPVTGMVAYGDGYLMVASDGGIFNFSSKPFAGSLGATPPPSPIVAVAPLDR